MKKLITILAILIVLVGAVFAANTTADIRVSTEIGEVAPGFKLAFKALTENSNTATYQTGYTSAESVAAESNPTKGQIVITTNDMLSKDADITFAVKQTVAKARKIANYTLSVATTDLKLYAVPNPTTGADETPSSAQIAASKFALSGDAAATITGVDNATYYTHGNPGTTVTFNFNGTPVPADTEIATFNYKWNKNADAIPGKYQADVVLTITASR